MRLVQRNTLIECCDYNRATPEWNQARAWHQKKTFDKQICRLMKYFKDFGVTLLYLSVKPWQRPVWRGCRYHPATVTAFNVVFGQFASHIAALSAHTMRQCPCNARK